MTVAREGNGDIPVSYLESLDWATNTFCLFTKRHTTKCFFFERMALIPLRIDPLVEYTQQNKTTPITPRGQNETKWRPVNALDEFGKIILVSSSVFL